MHNLLAVAQVNLPVLIVVGICAGLGLAAIASKGKDGLVAKRKTWQNLSSFFQELGLPHTKGLFNELAVGDVAGALTEAKSIEKILEDPKLREEVVAGVVDRYLTKHKDEPAKVNEVLTSLGLTFAGVTAKDSPTQKVADAVNQAAINAMTNASK